MQLQKNRRKSILCRLLPAAAALTLMFSVTAQAAGWENMGNGFWRYQKEDGTYLINGYTPDGYYINVNGQWREQEDVLGIKFPMGNQFLSPSRIGSMTVFENMLVNLLKEIARACGNVRSFTLDSEKIGYEKVTENGTTEILSFYQDTNQDGYVLRLKGALLQVQSQPPKTSWYDYQVVRALMHSVSRTGEYLTDAVFQSWEGKNSYGLKFGEWVPIGDAYIKYEAVDGAGLYFIRPNPEV